MIEFEYRENGVAGKFDLDIDFISRGIRKLIQNSLGEVVAYKNMMDKTSDNITTIAALRVEKPDGFQTKIKELEQENKAVFDAIRNVTIDQIETDRINLIRRILKDNGIDENHKLFNDNFCENCIETKTIIHFLTHCYLKDTIEANQNQKKNIEKMTV